MGATRRVERRGGRARAREGAGHGLARASAPPHRPLLFLVLAAFAAPGPGGGLRAQEAPPPADSTSRTGAARSGAPADPGGHPFRTPIGSAIEPLHRLVFAHVSRDTVERGVVLADLGDRLAFWILRRPEGRVELAGALSAGAFSRFDLQTDRNEFLEVHYRVGFQLRARLGKLAARTELYHVSSHLGDELLVRTGGDPISTSREGVELLLQAAPFPGLTVHAGPGLLLRSTEGLERTSARLGAEWTASGAEAGGRGPYVAAEAFAWAELDWDPLLAVEGGVAFGPRARLGAVFGAGPSRAEQFFRDAETLVGLSFSYRR